MIPLTALEPFQKGLGQVPPQVALVASLLNDLARRLPQVARGASLQRIYAQQEALAACLAWRSSCDRLHGGAPLRKHSVMTQNRRVTNGP